MNLYEFADQFGRSAWVEAGDLASALELWRRRPDRPRLSPGESEEPTMARRASRAPVVRAPGPTGAELIAAALVDGDAARGHYLQGLGFQATTGHADGWSAALEWVRAAGG